MTEEMMSTLNGQLFAVWFLLGAALVFWMQAGFAMVEAGFTRAKNSGNILMNLSKTPLGGLAGNKDLPLADKLFLEEKNIIEKAAEEGNCVIVGRASGYILRKHENSLQVFIYADHEKRLQRAIEREGIQKADAESALKKNDKRRRNFYNSITGQDWDDPKHYEMYLNAGRLGIDLSVRLLMEAAKG